MKALRIATDIARLSTVVSIYQVSESLYKLFDKVCVIYEGRQAYFGPAAGAKQYFIDMGYEPANRQTTADFLVQCTDPLARISCANIIGQPRSAAEFADYYKASSASVANQEDMESYKAEHVGNQKKADDYIRGVRAERANHTREESSYTISVPMQVRAVMLRRVQIILGSKAAQVTQFL